MSTTTPQHCAHCGMVLGMTRWSVGPLPWWFCSAQCGRDYYQKDGATERQFVSSEDK